MDRVSQVVAEGIGGRQVDFLVGGTFRRFITVEIGRSPRCQGEAGDAKSEGRLETCSPFDRTLSKIRTQKIPLHGKCGSAIVFLSHDACKRGKNSNRNAVTMRFMDIFIVLCIFTRVFIIRYIYFEGYAADLTINSCFMRFT